MMSSAVVDVSAILGWGVYLLSYRGKVVYVGKSKCPLSRISAHRSLARRPPPPWLPIRGVVFDKIEIVPSHPDRIDELERALIEFHRPRHNTQHVPPEPLLDLPKSVPTLVLNLR